ncbi:MAG: hypothetical protein IJW46_01600 [Clostridia bacterium]|nr:hypothetical protein [Clostridia bacterium]
MKECTLCAKGIDHIKEPALLFIGKYGRRYEICLECEELMDTLVSGEYESERKNAGKTVYRYLFEREGDPISGEVVSFFKDLLAEGSELMQTAQENLDEYEREEEQRRLEAEEAAKKALLAAEEATAVAVDEASISEEEFLKDETEPLSLKVRILFFLLFTLLAAGAVTYGILQSNTVSIVIGAIVFLLGAVSSFSKG